MPAPVEVEKRVQTVCLLILSAVAIAFALYWLQTTLVPVVVAFLLMMVLKPLVAFQVRSLRLPHWLAVLGTIAISFAVIVGLSIVVSVGLTQLGTNVARYQEQFEKVVSKAMDVLPLERIGIGGTPTPKQDESKDGEAPKDDAKKEESKGSAPAPKPAPKADDRDAAGTTANDTPTEPLAKNDAPKSAGDAGKDAGKIAATGETSPVPPLATINHLADATPDTTPPPSSAAAAVASVSPAAPELPPQADTNKRAIGNLIGVSSQTIVNLLVNVLTAVLNIVSHGVLVLIFLSFLLTGQRYSRAVAAPAPQYPPGSFPSVWVEIESHVKRYLIAKTGVSVFAGILVWCVLTVLGVPLALVFGLMACLLNFVPNIGSIVATLLPLPVVLVDPNVSATTAVLAIAIPAGIQIVLGSLVEPRIIGNSLDLHPVTILLALIFWGTMWGVIGMLLAAPITAILRILLEKLEITAPIGRLLAGRTGTAT